MNATRIGISILAFWWISLPGCATNQVNSEPDAIDGGPTLERIRQTLNEAQIEPTAILETPDAIRSALLPSIGLDLPPGSKGALRSAPEEPRFDISVDRTPARPFFMGLVKDTPHNMVVHPSVDGTISLDLKNVTVEDVMEIVREVYGFEYEKNRSGYVVLPARMQSRIFHVDYLNVQRTGRSTTLVNSGQISETTEEDSSNGDGGDAESTVRRMVGSAILTQTESSFWQGLRETIKAIVGSGEGRSVVVSPHAGLVVVRAMPGELRDVARFIEAAQNNLHRQVILEAKIVEVELKEGFQAGINWSAINDSVDPSIFAAQSTLIDGASSVFQGDGAFDPNSVISAADPDDFAFGGLFAISARSDDFTALLNLLSAQGNTQVLSSPRVSTLNNQKAVIKVGTDEFFVTDIESTTTTGTSTTTTPRIELTPFFSGIALDVTPQITQHGEVILHIHPTVSEVRDQTKNITVAGQTQTLPLAFSSVRESDSIVRALNGQLVIIGGLMQDKNTTNRGKTPILSKLPLIGNLFKQKQQSSSRSELVILLRPMVVNKDRTWAKAAQDASGRIEDLTSQAQAW